MRVQIDLTFDELDEDFNLLQQLLRQDIALRDSNVRCVARKDGRLHIALQLEAPTGLPVGARRDSFLARIWRATEPLDRAFDAIYEAVEKLGWPPVDIINMSACMLIAGEQRPHRLAPVVDLPHRPTDR